MTSLWHCPDIYIETLQRALPTMQASQPIKVRAFKWLPVSRLLERPKLRFRKRQNGIAYMDQCLSTHMIET